MERLDKLKSDSGRIKRELAYLDTVAHEDTESIWGWGSPAGKLRAERRAQLIAQGAGLCPSKLVLEVGCGTGLFTEKFACYQVKLVAVDLFEDLLKKARARGLSEKQVSFIKTPFEDCEVEGPFDAIIGSSILHHLVIEPSLEKIFKMLKPGGILSFAEPNMLNPQVLLERVFAPLVPWVSPDETAFIRWRLETLLKKCGFRNITITPFDWLHPSTPVPLIRMVQKLGSTLEKIPGVKEFSGSLIIRAERE